MKDVGIGEMLPHPPPQKINVLLHGGEQAQVGGDSSQFPPENIPVNQVIKTNL